MKALRFIYLLIFTVVFISCSKDDVDNYVTDSVEEVSSSAYFKITRPLRGDYILTGAGRNLLSGVLVEGIVCDSINEVVGVKINGTSIPVNNQGSECDLFSTEIQGEWGMNTIVAQSVNDQGDEVTVAQSFMRSSVFSSQLENNTANPNSISIRIGQDLIDDGDRADPANDFVSIFDALLTSGLESFKISNLLGDVVFNNLTSTRYECGLLGNDVVNRLQGVKISTINENNFPDLTVTPKAEFINGELEIGIEIKNLLAGFKGDIWKDRECNDPWHWEPEGIFGFDKIEVALKFSITLDDEGINIALNGIKLFTDWKIELDWGLLDHDFTWTELDNQARDNYKNTFTTRLENGLAFLFNDNTIVSILELIGIGCDGLDALNSGIEVIHSTGNSEEFSSATPQDPKCQIDLINELFNYLNFDHNIPNIPATTEQVGLIVEAKTSNINIGTDSSGKGYLDYGIAVNVFPENIIKDRGEIPVCLDCVFPEFDGMEGTFGIGINYNFINQTLWALWAGGSFDESIDTSGTMEDLNENPDLQEMGLKIISIEAMSPPVLMRDGDGALKFGVGNIKMKAEKTTTVVQEGRNPWNGQPYSFDETAVSELDIYIETYLHAELEFDSDKNELSFMWFDPASGGTDDTIITVVTITPTIDTPETDNLKEKLGELISGIMRDKLTNFPPLAIPSIPLNYPDYSIDGTLEFADGQFENNTLGGYIKITGGMLFRD